MVTHLNIPWLWMQRYSEQSPQEEESQILHLATFWHYGRRVMFLPPYCQLYSRCAVYGSSKWVLKCQKAPTMVFGWNSIKQIIKASIPQPINTYVLTVLSCDLVKNQSQKQLHLKSYIVTIFRVIYSRKKKTEKSAAFFDDFWSKIVKSEANVLS